MVKKYHKINFKVYNFIKSPILFPNQKKLLIQIKGRIFKKFNFEIKKNYFFF
jgi:hypothetical protein